MNLMTDSGVCHRALIVEDDPAIRRLVEKLLQVRCLSVHDGEMLNGLMLLHFPDEVGQRP